MGDRTMSLVETIRSHVRESAAAIAALDAHADAIATAATALVERLTGGGTVYTCGNGGSAAEALHLAEELIGNYRDRRRPPQRAICLNADPTALTCIANDFGFDEVFARQCRALITPADALVVLSTSGESENIVGALEVARQLGATTIGLLGRDGGRCGPLCTHAIIIDHEEPARIQEAHLLIVHLLCEAAEATGTPRA